MIKVSKLSSSTEIVKEIYEKIQPENQTIREIIMQQQRIQNESMLDLSSALKDSLYKMGMEILKNNVDAQSRMQDTIIRSLREMQNVNDRRYSKGRCH